MPGPWEKYKQQEDNKKELGPWEKYKQPPSEELGTAGKLLQEYGETYLKPSLQAGGAALGGIAGTAAGPLGTVAGGGLGYASGEQVYRILKQLAGIQEAKTPAEELKQFARSALEGATAEMGGMGAGAAISGATKALPGIAKKLGRAIYNVPENAISEYAKNPQLVNRAITESPSEAGKRLLNDLATAKSAKVTAANKGLSDTLAVATANNKKVPIKPVIDELTDMLTKVEKVGVGKQYYDELVNEIKRLKQIRKETGGWIPIDRANNIKRMLQASAEYQDGIFKVHRTDPVGSAYRDAASTIRKSIEEKAPEVKKYNQALKEILDFETDPKFKQAFSDANIEGTVKNIQSETGNKSYLRDLAKQADDVLGTNILGETKAQYAAKYFRQPDLLSGHPTGRSLLAGGIGSGVGMLTGGPAGAAVGGLAGAALSSPSVLKAVTPKAVATNELLNKLIGSGIFKAETKALPYQIQNFLDTKE